MLNKETKIIEYCRQRYLRQAIIVVLLIGSLLVAALYYTNFIASKILALIISILLTYIMLKELRNDLQARGEGTILSTTEPIFNQLKFDIGKGINENTLSDQELVTDYQIRECRNIIRGNNFSLEEDTFYSIISTKFLALNHTTFEGIIAEITTPMTLEYAKGQLELIQNKPISSGELMSFLKKYRADTPIIELMHLLKAKKTLIASMRGKIYIWFETSQPLHHQLSLIKPNSATTFVNRIDAIKKQIDNFSALLKG
ncbi:MAG: hypothetical protein J6W96_04655 [Alphaproteobacteria bacterium]|nr:hypothetical protein [Alphaproteobacteria bacterium]